MRVWTRGRAVNRTPVTTLQRGCVWKARFKRRESMNAINVIAPYQYEGMWVFDDPRVGLDKEPFVSGADTMIDVLVGDIPDAEKGFRLLFSSLPFPGYTFKLDWRRQE